MTIASLHNVRKQFPGAKKPALNGIWAEIRKGMITGLVGPDGAGKTTLLRLMAGLMHPSEGTIRILGLDPVADAPALRSQIGYMPQKFGLYEDLSVQENLDLYADLRGVLGKERRDAFVRLLEFTDLTRFTGRFAGKLSGGMKQKLGLACSLLGTPKILLLDEPGVGVDPISRRELWKMVEELVSQGMTVVWSTAYLDEAEMCQETLLLSEGEMLFTGKPSDLTARVQGRCVQIRDITANKRSLLNRALKLPEVMDGSIQGDSVRLMLRKSTERLPLETLDAGANARIVHMPPHFEDAFIDSLGGGPGGDSELAIQMNPIPLDGMTVIEAEKLTKRFGDFAAADNVTFSVRRGEIFGLLGPNGAGKSTTFKMLCGLLTPTSGSAKVMGFDLKHSGPKARQRLGYMAQKFSLYGNLTVLQNLMFFSGTYGLTGAQQREEVEGMIEVFHLQPFLETTPDTLPLGFKQRLALACAVMHSPDILFLDEPTSGVDPVTRREFWTHINGVVEKGVTVMVTTHFMDEAEYCDRIGLVFRGQLIAIGTPDELKAMSVTPEHSEPGMEDAFIELILRSTEAIP